MVRANRVGRPILLASTKNQCTNALGIDVLKPLNCSTLATHAPNREIYVFIHAVQSDNLAPVLVDMLLSLESAGLLAISRRVEICLSGASLLGINEMLAGFKSHMKSERLKVIHVSKDPLAFEIPTINRVLQTARTLASETTDAHILYVHTKGLFSTSAAFVPKWFWRKTMEYWLVEQHVRCRSMLEYGYDAVGINAMRGHLKRTRQAGVGGNMVHYSGNFWWASARHLARLSEIDISHRRVKTVERFKAENLVLSALPNMCAGVLFNWGFTHMYDAREVPDFDAMRRTTASCDVL